MKPKINLKTLHRKNECNEWRKLCQSKAAKRSIMWLSTILPKKPLLEYTMKVQTIRYLKLKLLTRFVRFTTFPITYYHLCDGNLLEETFNTKIVEHFRRSSAVAPQIPEYLILTTTRINYLHTTSRIEVCTKWKSIKIPIFSSGYNLDLN